ncbi:MAG: Bifunctional protein HldE [Firmicutes bacterium ADurb.Bin419]|nr:MAG: Bifunctional protein HldE [Firmicutes bacterium ADurb.Bin419]
MPRTLIDTLENLKTVVDVHKYLGHTIVFTNGCFDIVHTGHIRLFEQAKKLGDIVVVGLNSDESVKLLKGEGHPIHTEQERAYVLGSIQYIDYIYIFNDIRCGEVIRAVCPHVYVKGYGYTKDSLEGSEKQAIVDSNSEIIILNTNDYSCSEMMERFNSLEVG